MTAHVTKTIFVSAQSFADQFHVLFCSSYAYWCPWSVSRLDYGNTTLSRILSYLLKWLVIDEFCCLVGVFVIEVLLSLSTSP